MTSASAAFPAASVSPSRRWLLLGSLVVVLLVAIGLVIYGENRPLHRTFHGHVRDLLPTAAELPGWSVEELPIADTPEMKKKVGEVLNYDDGAFYVYTHGTDRLSVYVAYWTPGRMSYRLIAAHTPDVCWVNGGWKVDSARSGVVLKPEGGNLKPEGGNAKPEGGDLKPEGSNPSQVSGLTPQVSPSLLPAEERTMSKDGATEYVAFWHRVGDGVVSYPRRGRPPWYAAFLDMWRRGLDQRREQFFIRLSSNLPVESWPEMAAYRMVLNKLPLSPSTR